MPVTKPIKQEDILAEQKNSNKKFHICVKPLFPSFASGELNDQIPVILCVFLIDCLR